MKLLKMATKSFEEHVFDSSLHAAKESTKTAHYRTLQAMGCMGANHACREKLAQADEKLAEVISLLTQAEDLT